MASLFGEKKTPLSSTEQNTLELDALAKKIKLIEGVRDAELEKAKAFRLTNKGVALRCFQRCSLLNQQIITMRRVMKNYLSPSQILPTDTTEEVSTTLLRPVPSNEEIEVWFQKLLLTRSAGIMCIRGGITV